MTRSGKRSGLATGFLGAAMAAAALVACAGGRLDAGKRRALQAVLADLDTGPAVDPGAAANLFNSFANGIRSQPTLGRKAALRAVASLAGDGGAAARLLAICHAIGSLGGGISARELTAIDRIAAALGAVPPALAKRIGFRLAAGFGERVVFHELFLTGLTVLDLPDDKLRGWSNLSLSHARREIDGLLATLGVPEADIL